MPIEIRRLTPDQWETYLDFFDNRAFTDGSPYTGCYCNLFYFTPEEIRAKYPDPDKVGWKAMSRAIRESAADMVREGRICGYFALDNGDPVGWCHANDRSGFVRVGEFNPVESGGRFLTHGGEEKILSVVCFEVAPPYRGQGIARMLLERVIRDAEEEGYDAVEAYPIARDRRETLDFTGPLKLFEKLGFVIVKDEAGNLTARRICRAAE